MVALKALLLSFFIGLLTLLITPAATQHATVYYNGSNSYVLKIGVMDPSGAAFGYYKDEILTDGNFCFKFFEIFNF